MLQANPTWARWVATTKGARPGVDAGCSGCAQYPNSVTCPSPVVQLQTVIIHNAAEPALTVTNSECVLQTRACVGCCQCRCCRRCRRRRRRRHPCRDARELFHRFKRTSASQSRRAQPLRRKGRGAAGCRERARPLLCLLKRVNGGDMRRDWRGAFNLPSEHGWQPPAVCALWRRC